MDTAALQVRSAAGSGFVANNDGAERILSILKDFSAPAAVDSVYEKVASFLQFKRTDETIDVYLLGFDMRRREPESKMHMAGAFRKHPCRFHERKTPRFPC